MKILNNRIKIINYFINSVSIDFVLKYILDFIKNNKSKYICISNVHSCIESFKDKKFKKAHNSADLALADGRPIFWALKLLGCSSAEHLPGYYVTEKICDLSNKKKLNIGFYGSTNENLKKIQKNLKKKI
jgi:N-acetylglucosaminyldiphosphoundecaprenol N-acetyl-beta-D-mannosaminyltransferase